MASGKTAVWLQLVPWCRLVWTFSAFLFYRMVKCRPQPEPKRLPVDPARPRSVAVLPSEIVRIHICLVGFNLWQLNALPFPGH